MKPSSWDQQRLTSPLEYAVGPKTAHNKPPTLKMRWGAECKSPQPPPPPEEGAGRSFFLDILFHRMSAKLPITVESLACSEDFGSTCHAYLTARGLMP